MLRKVGYIIFVINYHYVISFSNETKWITVCFYLFGHQQVLSADIIV